MQARHNRLVAEVEGVFVNIVLLSLTGFAVQLHDVTARSTDVDERAQGGGTRPGRVSVGTARGTLTESVLPVLYSDEMGKTHAIYGQQRLALPSSVE